MEKMIYKKLNFYIVDMEYKNIFTKKELIYFYIMSLFFFDWLNVINDKINKKFFDKLAQYNAKC